MQILRASFSWMATLRHALVQLQRSKTHEELVEATIVAIESFDQKIEATMSSILDIVKANGQVTEIVMKQLEEVLDTIRNHDQWEKEQKYPSSK